MSTQPKTEFIDEELSEQAVHDYLAAHPDFFERHSTLLSSLNLPHASGGAVSLVERQISVLRQKDLKLERQLKELIEVARANDTLAAKIHELTLQLLATTDLQKTIAAIEEAMRSGFGADHAVLVLFAEPDSLEDINAARFFRVIERGHFSTARMRVAARFAILSVISCSRTMHKTSGPLPWYPSAKAPRSVSSPLAA
jgi:uncharacterized protein YigA (DUF484 family)